MIYELSSLDRYGEFCHWFQMPLTKVDSIVDMLIDREYVKPSRSLIRRAEFCERSELFVMSALTFWALDIWNFEEAMEDTQQRINVLRH